MKFLDEGAHPPPPALPPRVQVFGSGFLCAAGSPVPRCRCADPACAHGGCLADARSKCVAPTFATNMIKHIGLNRTWPNSRTAQRTILDLQLSSGFWGDGLWFGQQLGRANANARQTAGRRERQGQRLQQMFQH